MRRRTPVLVAILLLCVAGIVEVRASLESSFIFPGAATQGRADTIVPASGDYELVPLQTRDGTRIMVTVSPIEGGSPRKFGPIAEGTIYGSD